MATRLILWTSTRLVRQIMPQLTLLSDPSSRSLSLSPQKSMTRTATTSSQSIGKKGDSNLLQMHHEEEDLAAAYKAQMKDRDAEAEGVTHDMGGEGGQATGQPNGAKKRERSPEGGGVAGSDAKRHKNAYEISKSSFQVKMQVEVLMAGGCVEGKVATAEDAARADQDPPLEQLIRLLKQEKKRVEKGESVVYWMRMEDVRSSSRVKSFNVC